MILNLFHEYILSTSLNVCFHHELPFLLIWNRSVLFVWKLYLLGSISSKVYQPSCRIHDKGLLLCSHWIWLSRRKRNDNCELLVSNQNNSFQLSKDIYEELLIYLSTFQFFNCGSKAEFPKQVPFLFFSFSLQIFYWIF